jgi:D-sedoheptulose 7-phosphate isomerase
MRISAYARKTVQCIEQAQWRVGVGSIDEAVWQVQADLMLTKISKQGRQVFVIGNGGSAAIASHLVVDLVNNLGLSAHTLHDCALLSCFSNDYGYEQAFALLLQKVAKQDDLLIVISSSGSSDNMVNATEAMIGLGGQVMSLTGFDEDNAVRLKTMESGGLSVWLPSDHYGYVETGHQLILHALVDGIMAKGEQ